MFNVISKTMTKLEIKYSLQELTLIPVCISRVNTRTQCNVLVPKQAIIQHQISETCLPIFTSPMSSIISLKNIDKFEKNGINVIIPRNIPYQQRLKYCTEYFIAISLLEFRQLIEQSMPRLSTMYICLDIADGHMAQVLYLIKKAKEIWGSKIQIMAGNIANPATYIEYCKAGCDYVRLNIGTGKVCTTSSNIGIHYPGASLLMECIVLRDKYFGNENNLFPGLNKTKIIYDGGLNNSDSIIKALALGADYVMLGSQLASLKEACGKKRIYFFKNHKFIGLEREYYGMSTKKAQAKMGKKYLRTGEGIKIWIPIKYSISSWVENLRDNIASAMSYLGATDYQEMRKNAKCVLNTPVNVISINK